jgi:hypothetical protein
MKIRALLLLLMLSLCPPAVLAQRTVTVSGTFTITIVFTNTAPVWVTPPPEITFESGVPASINISQYVTDKDGDKLTITLQQILDSVLTAAGVSYDPSTTTLRYDGTPVHQTVTGTAVFIADDGRGGP